MDVVFARCVGVFVAVANVTIVADFAQEWYLKHIGLATQEMASVAIVVFNALVDETPLLED